MEIIKTAFDGVYLIKPTYFEDDRGYFVETFSEKELAEKTGLRFGRFVQDSQAYNRTKGTFRGIHAQIEPHAQIKLVWCTRGSIMDYVVDLRANSPTFGKWISFEISYSEKLVPADTFIG